MLLEKKMLLPVFRIMILLLCGMASIPVQAQPFTADFNLKTPDLKVFLASYYGEKMALIDSGVTRKSGEISFLFSQKRPTGIYRVFTDRQHFLEFIYNKEDVDIEMDINKGDKAPAVKKSKENEIFYDFLTKEADFNRKLNVLQVVGSEYPEKDAFYKNAKEHYDDLLRERNQLLKNLISNHQSMFVSRILKLYQEPDLDWTLNEQDRKEQLLEHYYDRFTLKDSCLIRTNLLTSKLIDYLSLYAGPQMNQSEAEQAFIKGIDVVMKTVEDDRTVFEFLLSYLVGGFEKYKMEQVLTHLYEKYLSDLACDEGGHKDELARRLKAYEQLAVGKTAPEFVVHDADNKEIKVSSMEADYYLLVFWASWCPHCQQMMARLPDLAPKFKEMKLNVVTISLDTSLVDWKKHLANNTFPWINTCEGQGWNGKVMKDYNIYATPTMFLLDRNRKIKAKPITYMDLTEALKQLTGN